ncbi:MAG: hypothetical protein U0574_09460 [Phycisphaerales bacterium]
MRPRGDWLGGLGLLLPLACCTRLFIPFAPRVRFDADPWVDPAPFPGGGPALSLALDAAAALGTTALLVSAVLRSQSEEERPPAPAAPARRAVLAGLLALLPALPILLRGSASLGDAWRGATWCIAALGAVALLVSPAWVRRTSVVLLLACSAALVVRCASQWWLEHPAMVAHYRAHRPELLAAQGWTEGSSEALAYERRVLQRETPAWFGLANVLSGVLASTSVGLLCLAAAGRRRAAGPAILAAAAGAAAALLVLLNAGKGAVASMLLGGLVGAALLAWRGRLSARAAPWAAGLLAAAALAGLGAVILRGPLGPDALGGERSLLYRWHYLQGAFQAVREAPLAGTGPDGFQDAYMRLRPSSSPEEVMSAHAAIVDWVAAAGAAGAAWVLLAAWMLWRALRDALRPPDQDDAEDERAAAQPAPRSVPLLAAVPPLAALLLMATVDGDEGAVALRGGSAVAAAVLAWALWPLLQGGGAVVAALAAAAWVLALHGQLDMIFWLPGSAMLPWLLLGAAAGWTAPAARARRASPFAALPAFIAVASLCLACTLGWWSVRAFRQQALVEAAADALASAGDAARADPGRTRAAAARAEFDARCRAAASLEAAFQLFPGHRLLRHDAALEWLRAASLPAALIPAEDLCRAAAGAVLAATLPAGAGVPGFPLQRLRVEAGWRRAQLRCDAGAAAEPPALRALEAEAETLLRLNPRSAAGWMRLGEIRTARGDSAAALQAWAKALEADDSFRLDPLKQLPAAERALLKRLMERGQDPAAAAGAPAGSPPVPAPPPPPAP